MYVFELHINIPSICITHFNINKLINLMCESYIHKKSNIPVIVKKNVLNAQ